MLASEWEGSLREEDKPCQLLNICPTFSQCRATGKALGSEGGCVRGCEHSLKSIGVALSGRRCGEVISFMPTHVKEAGSG